MENPFQPGDRVYWIRSKRPENTDSGQQVPALVTSVDGSKVKLELRTCTLYSDTVLKAEVVLDHADIEHRDIPSALFQEAMQYDWKGFAIDVIHASELGMHRAEAWYGTICQVPVTQACTSQDLAFQSALRALTSGSINDRIKPMALTAAKTPEAIMAQRVLALRDKLHLNAQLFDNGAHDAASELHEAETESLDTDDEDLDIEHESLA